MPDKPAQQHHKLLGLELTDGFLKGMKLEFADGLDGIIGGRGTGKTTALEFVRCALGLAPDHESDTKGSCRLHPDIEVGSVDCEGPAEHTSAEGIRPAREIAQARG